MVPLVDGVKSPVVPSGKVAVTVSCVLAPMELRVVVGAVVLRTPGTGVGVPNVIAIGPTTPFVGTVKKSDWPDVVTPLRTHVARARTCPRLDGTLDIIHEPSGFACAVRLSTLTVHV